MLKVLIFYLQHALSYFTIKCVKFAVFQPILLKQENFKHMVYVAFWWDLQMAFNNEIIITAVM